MALENAEREREREINPGNKPRFRLMNIRCHWKVQLRSFVLFTAVVHVRANRVDIAGLLHKPTSPLKKQYSAGLLDRETNHARLTTHVSSAAYIACTMSPKMLTHLLLSWQTSILEMMLQPAGYAYCVLYPTGFFEPA
jgi:hypothetical protein